MTNQIKGFLLVAAYPLDDQYECGARYQPVKMFHCKSSIHDYVENEEVDFPEYQIWYSDGEENFKFISYHETPVRCCKCGSKYSDKEHKYLLDMDWRAGETSTTCLCHDCYEKAHRFDGITFNGKPLGEIIG